MSEQTLTIDIQLAADQARQQLAELEASFSGTAQAAGGKPKQEGATHDPTITEGAATPSDAILDELRQLKAETRLANQHLRELAELFRPLAHFLLDE